MSEANTTPNDKSLAAVFLRAADDRAYLGDPGTVEDLLRAMIFAALDARWKFGTGLIEESELAQTVNAEMERCAGVLLGRDKTFTPLVGWNEPGGIDSHIAVVMNNPDPEPAHRIMAALRALINVVCALVAQEEAGMPEENTRWQIDAEIAETVKLCLGLPLTQPGDE